MARKRSSRFDKEKGRQLVKLDGDGFNGEGSKDISLKPENLRTVSPGQRISRYLNLPARSGFGDVELVNVAPRLSSYESSLKLHSHL